MDKGKLKVLLHDLETVVESIKSEIYSDVNAYQVSLNKEYKGTKLLDYDEVFEDND